MGLMVNTVLLRTDLGNNPTCREVLQRVRATTLAAYAHQDLPFEELVRTLEHERNLQRTSLGQVMVIWQNFMLRSLQYSAQTLSFQEMGQGVVAPDVALTTFDIILTLRERPQGLSGTCLYKTELFDTAVLPGPAAKEPALPELTFHRPETLAVELALPPMTATACRRRPDTR